MAKKTEQKKTGPTTRDPGVAMTTVDRGQLALGLKTTFEGVAMVFGSLGADCGFEIMEMAEEPKEQTVVDAKKKTTSRDDKTTSAPQAHEEAEVGTTAEGVIKEAAGTTEARRAEQTVSATEENENEEEKNDVSEGTSGPGLAPAGTAGSKAAAEEKTAPGAEADKKQEASGVTLDDVTKIIVQKIKQNRSNNERIGQILRTYGVAKVGELPQAKYEAFLTDLAAL